MDVRAVVLDRDGVLADFDYAAANAFFQPLLPLSLETISDKWDAWGARVGFPQNLTEERQFFRGFWDSLGDELNLGTAVRSQLHDFDYTTCMFAFPEVRTTLQMIRQRGMRIGVLSNFSLASLDASLDAIGLGGLVDAALAAPVIGVAKPDLRAYSAISDALDVELTKCLFLDDEAPCVEGARAAGMTAFLVDRRRKEHQISDGIVCDLSMLPSILDTASGTRTPNR